jgi:hypothetical protein
MGLSAPTLPGKPAGSMAGRTRSGRANTKRSSSARKRVPRSSASGMCSPTAARRVSSRPQDWPGVHSARALVNGAALTGTWFDRTQEYAARRRGEEFDRLRYATTETLHLLSPAKRLAGTSFGRGSRNESKSRGHRRKVVFEDIARRLPEIASNRITRKSLPSLALPPSRWPPMIGLNRRSTS